MDEMKEIRVINDLQVSPARKEIDDLNLSDMTIGSGEVVVIKDKRIYFSTVIVCRGKLIFENCEIHYGEEGISGKQIILDTAAVLSFKNCIIENHALVSADAEEATYFIRIDKTKCQDRYILENPVTIDGCRLINCCKMFYEGVSACIENCQAINPGISFIESAFGFGSYHVIHSSDILFDRSIPFLEGRTMDKNTVMRTNALELSQVVIRDISDDKEAGYGDFMAKNKMILFTAEEYVSASNCFFSGIGNEIFSVIIGKLNVRQSVFENCIYDTAKARPLMFCAGEVHIEDCRFDNCFGVLVGENSIIRNCQFNDCGPDGSSIIGTWASPIDVKNCEFNGWTGVLVEKESNAHDGQLNSEKSKIVSDWFYRLGIKTKTQEFMIPGLINYKRYGSSEDRISMVENCVFRNIKANGSFAIHSAVDDVCNIVSFIKGCEFIDCTTETKDRQLINTVHYIEDPKEGKKKVTVANVENCVGWKIVPSVL